MKHIVLTRKHILAALDVKPHVFRQWTEKLDPYRSQESKIRIFRKFDKRDLLFFSVARSLLIYFKIPIEVIGTFSGNLAASLAKPMSAVSPRSIFVNIKSCDVSSYRLLTSESGIVMELEPHFRLCDAFFDCDGEDKQTLLPFGLVDLGGQSRKSGAGS